MSKARHDLRSGHVRVRFGLWGLTILLVLTLTRVPFGMTWSGTRKNDSAQLISALLEVEEFQGTVLIARNRKVILKTGYGLANREWGILNTPDTKFKIGSITKPFTAVLVLQLVQSGKLRLDDRIANHLPDYPPATGSQITLHQLLTHTSGIPDFLRQPDFAGEKLRLTLSPVALTQQFQARDLEFSPGKEFRYSNSGYVLLGRIVEKVTGSPLEDVLRERILSPLGMNDTGCFRNEQVVSKMAAGYDRNQTGSFRPAPYVDPSLAYGGGDMFSTVGDLFKFDQALYTDQLVSKESIELMEQVQIATPSGNGYGYGWDIVQTPIRFVGHMGDASGFISVILRMPNTGDTIILLSNEGKTQLRKIATGIYRIVLSS